MKIAICLSGFMRYSAYAVASIDRFVQQNKKFSQVDVFAHTYRENFYEWSSKMDDELLTEAEIRRRLYPLNIRALVIEDRDKEMQHVQKQVDVLINDPTNDIIRRDSLTMSNYNQKCNESSDAKIKPRYRLAERIYDQLRKISLCNELRRAYEVKTNTTYDLVIKSRFEIVFVEEPKWQSCLDAAHKRKTILTGHGALGEGMVDDIVAISTPELMNVYSERVHDLNARQISTICAHASLIQALCDRRGIRIERGAVSYCVMRGPHLIQYPYVGTHPPDARLKTFLSGLVIRTPPPTLSQANLRLVTQPQPQQKEQQKEEEPHKPTGETKDEKTTVNKNNEDGTWDKELSIETTLSILTDSIQTGKNVLFVKFGDGEHSCVQGVNGHNCDGDAFRSDLGTAIASAFKTVARYPQCIVGRWWTETARKVWTEAVGDGGFSSMKAKWANYNSLLVTHESVKTPSLQRFYSAIRHSSVPKFFVSNYLMERGALFLGAKRIDVALTGWFTAAKVEELCDTIINDVKASSVNVKPIVLTACGMGAKPLIARLFEKTNGQCVCLDLGSALDFLCTKTDSRGWSLPPLNLTYEAQEEYFGSMLPVGWNDPKFDVLFNTAKECLGRHLKK